MKFIKYIILVLSLISLAWAANALKITSSAQLLAGSNATGVVGDYLLNNDSASFIISDIPNTLSPGKSGGLCIDAVLNGGLDDFDLMYLYLDKDWPRQSIYSTINIISDGASSDSAHIRVNGVDSDNAGIAISTDYILYDNTPMMKVKTRFYNQSASTVNSYDMGDAFSWGSNPFVPGIGSTREGSSTTSWLASITSNTLYGYLASEDFFATHGEYWSDATLEEVNLAAGDSVSILRYFMVSKNLAGIYTTYLDLYDISSGSITVSVSLGDQPGKNALVYFIQGSDSGPTFEDQTNNLGILNAQLGVGTWICRVIANGQTKEQVINISADSNQDLSFIFGEATTLEIGQDTLTIIQSPLINIPTMALPDDTISVKINLAESESVQSLSLLFNGNEYALNFVESSISTPFGLRTLEAYLPPSMFYGLYDLKIMCTGTDSMDISEHALYVIPEYKNDFSFIQVTDTHMPSHHFWGEDGLESDSTELEDFRAVINDINIINPDFVLHTGDFINDGEIEALGIPSISRGKALLHELEVPLFLVAGNHDLGGWDSTPASDGTARRTWWKYFGWEYLSSISTTDTTTQNYTFNYGDVHFIGLEAYDNYDEWRYELYGETSFISSQLQWLSEDLTEHASSPLKILFYHYDFKHELNLSTLGVDAAFWGHIHGNTEDSTLPYSVSTGATCDGARWYRLITVSNNVITSMKTFQAGSNGELISKTVSSNKLSITLTNNSNTTFHDCLVTFPLEEGKQVESISNAVLMQIDTLSTPKIVYANLDLLANSSVTATMAVEDTVVTEVFSMPESTFLTFIYPNPFNPILTINVQLPTEMKVDVDIFNLQGKSVYSRVSLHMNKGTNTIKWDASEQPSGLYFIQTMANNSIESFQTINKCLLLK
jgi:predicted phosphodiesterase